MIFIGWEKWTSKNGNVGYNIYCMDEVGLTGSGAKYHMIYRNGYRNIPSTDELHFKEVFKDMPLKTQIDELYFNDRGYISGCKIHKI